MDKHTSLEVQALSALTRSFKLHKVDLGQDVHLKKGGMAFDTEAWEIEGIGHLCIMKMKAFLGLMRMETVVIAPTQVDLPLFNADWVNAAGTETQMVEFYDTQLAPWPHASQARFHEILDRYADTLNAHDGPGTIRTQEQLTAGLSPKELESRRQLREAANAAIPARRRLEIIQIPIDSAPAER